jgi:hypothetical protein
LPGGRAMTRISRREALAGAAAAAAGGVIADAASATAKARSRRPTRRVDVVVVGAGLAGLTAATDLDRPAHGRPARAASRRRRDSEPGGSRPRSRSAGVGRQDRVFARAARTGSRPSRRSPAAPRCSTTPARSRTSPA